MNFKEKTWKVFFEGEVYEMPTGFKGVILDKILTKNKNSNWVPLIVENKDECLIILGRKVDWY